MNLFEDADDGEPSEGSAPYSIGDLTEERPSALNAIDIPKIELPKGGGAVRGIDQSFEVNGANGTAAATLALPITPGRSGFGPEMRLAYSSGAGNGPFGMGWDLVLPAIQRRTDRRLPRYLEGQEEDVFMLSGAEDLVPELTETAPGVWARRPQDLPDGTRIERYRPRIAGDFAKIERITHPVHGVYWKVTSAANASTIYGRSAAARLADPDDPRRVLRWLPEFAWDNKGNWMSYLYQAEDGVGQPATTAEAHRAGGVARVAATYLKRVRYSNRTAYYPDPTRMHDPDAPADGYAHFELVLDYGDHAPDDPMPQADRPWAWRADAFSNHRGGFEQRTARLCKRILMFHHFPNETVGENALTRSLDLTYDHDETNGFGQAGVALLTAAQEVGYLRAAAGHLARKAMPDTRFTYSAAQWNDTAHPVTNAQLPGLPTGALPPWRLVDLWSEGIAGLLTEQGNAWHYARNAGVVQTGEVQFEAPQTLSSLPNYRGLAAGRMSLQELEGDGLKQLVVPTPQGGGYFELDPATGWAPFRAFAQTARVDPGDPTVRRIDLTGDGRAELVVGEVEAFVWYEGQGRAGWGAAERVPLPLDDRAGPRVVFSDPLSQIYLADMTGDGLSDIVRVRNGAVQYWPNRGYGRFGARVSMDAAPLFDHPDRFDPTRVQLADLDGSGPADLIYTGGEAVRVWSNRAGNGWGAARVMGSVPRLDGISDVQVADLLGQGTACLVWSSPLPGHSGAPLRYIDPMGGVKPFLLTGSDNGMGRNVALSYESSTQSYLRDRLNGTPWVTRLPFPVQTVVQMETQDHITGTRLTSRYSFHHGHFDPVEREFRGFGRVDRQDTEAYSDAALSADGNSIETGDSLMQAPMLYRSWYHLGLPDSEAPIRDAFTQEFWPAAFDRAFPAAALGHVEPQLPPDARIVAARTILDPGALDALSAEERREAARACKALPMREEVFALDAPGIGATEDELRRQHLPIPWPPIPVMCSCCSPVAPIVMRCMCWPRMRRWRSSMIGCRMIRA